MIHSPDSLPKSLSIDNGTASIFLFELGHLHQGRNQIHDKQLRFVAVDLEDFRGQHILMRLGIGHHFGPPLLRELGNSRIVRIIKSTNGHDGTKTLVEYLRFMPLIPEQMHQRPGTLRGFVEREILPFLIKQQIELNRRVPLLLFTRRNDVLGLPLERGDDQ